MVGLDRRKDNEKYAGNTNWLYRTIERSVIMCMRFVYNEKDTILGKNFDIDLSMWQQTVITEKGRFFLV